MPSTVHKAVNVSLLAKQLSPWFNHFRCDAHECGQIAPLIQIMVLTFSIRDLFLAETFYTAPDMWAYKQAHNQTFTDIHKETYTKHYLVFVCFTIY